MGSDYKREGESIGRWYRSILWDGSSRSALHDELRPHELARRLCLMRSMPWLSEPSDAPILGSRRQGNLDAIDWSRSLDRSVVGTSLFRLDLDLQGVISPPSNRQYRSLR
jgi:hypothetical protein